MPIKRHKSLHTISHEHHYGLLFAWKIRRGFQKSIAIDRIAAYADWFWTHYLIPHFSFEEAHIFTLLSQDDEKILKALADHQQLKELFENKHKDQQCLSSIEKKLNDHIRFEERILFQEIQVIATESQLKKIEDLHHKTPDKEWIDEFWI